MTHRRRWPKVVFAYVVALLLGTILGSIIQTQLNLLSLSRLGADFDSTTRLVVTMQDLVHFGPIYGAILGVSLAISQAFAVALAKRAGRRWISLLCALGAGLGLWAAVRLVDALAPMPTFIAATRSTMGMFAMAGSAALAGWAFSGLLAGSRLRSNASAALPLIGLFSLSNLMLSADVRAEKIYELETVAEGLVHPWSVAFLPDGRKLVTERPGRLRVISADDKLMAKPVEGLPSRIFAQGQTGLLEVLAAKDFAQSQYVFLSYACGDAEANHLCLARGRLLGNQAEKTELVEVEEIFRTQPAKAGAAHFGGRMAWLPDETLILTFGDGFDYREQAQNPANHLGSIFRLNRDGSAPENNPFIGQPGIRPEIYSYGHRNVQGLIYDESGSRLFAHEHGPRGGDEINLIRPGENYGWPIATHGLDYTWARVTPYQAYPGTVQPVLHWTPSIAPSGMTFYQGEMFPEWQDTLLVGALVTRRVHRVKLVDGQPVEQTPLFEELNERIRDVRTGPDGAVYLLTDAPDGRLLRAVRPGK